jgi:hypothetical protein
MKLTKQQWIICSVILLAIILALFIFIPSGNQNDSSDLEREITEGLIDEDSDINVGEIIIPGNLEGDDIAEEVSEGLIDEDSETEIGELFEF